MPLAGQPLAGPLEPGRALLVGAARVAARPAGVVERLARHHHQHGDAPDAAAGRRRFSRHVQPQFLGLSRTSRVSASRSASEKPWSRISTAAANGSGTPSAARPEAARSAASRWRLHLPTDAPPGRRRRGRRRRRAAGPGGVGERGGLVQAGPQPRDQPLAALGLQQPGSAGSAPRSAMISGSTSKAGSRPSRSSTRSRAGTYAPPGAPPQRVDAQRRLAAEARSRTRNSIRCMPAVPNHSPSAGSPAARRSRGSARRRPPRTGARPASPRCRTRPRPGWPSRRVEHRALSPDRPTAPAPRQRSPRSLCLLGANPCSRGTLPFRTRPIGQGPGKLLAVLPRIPLFPLGPGWRPSMFASDEAAAECLTSRFSDWRVTVSSLQRHLRVVLRLAVRRRERRNTGFQAVAYRVARVLSFHFTEVSWPGPE